MSTATVSRSLAQNMRVHPATRAKVAKIAMEMGYQGRSRRQKKNEADESQYQIAVVLQGPGYQSSINAMKLLEGLTAEADGADVRLHIGLAPVQERAQVILPTVCTEAARCDLTILMGRHHPKMVGELVGKCPVVSATTRYANLAHDHADTADYWGLHELATRVVALGHRRLAWISESTINTGDFDEMRQAGLIQVCRRHGIEISDVQWLDGSSFDDEGNLNVARVRQALAAKTTCFICATDRVAFQILGLMRKWGIDVPGKVSVTGFDAVQNYMPSAPPKLASVDPSWIEIGRAAMSLALRRLVQPSAPHMTVTVGFRFVMGDTLGRARS